MGIEIDRSIILQTYKHTQPPTVRTAESEAAHFQRRNLQWLSATDEPSVSHYPAVLPRTANLKHFQRRNLQWLSATDEPSVSHYPRRFATLSQPQTFPKAEFGAAHCRPALTFLLLSAILYK